MRGMSRHRAGVLFGTTAPVTMPPALPNDVAVPGARGSSSVTSWPSRCRCSAQDTPTMPAPMTATRISVVPLSSLAQAVARRTAFRGTL